MQCGDMTSSHHCGAGRSQSQREGRQLRAQASLWCSRGSVRNLLRELYAALREKWFTNKFEGRFGHHVGRVGIEALVDALTVFMPFSGQHSYLEGRGTCGCLSGFHGGLEATWLLCGPGHLWMSLAGFMWPRKQHGALEDQDTSGCR